MNPLTKEQRRVMRNYTAVIRFNGGFAPKLIVGVQSFVLLHGTREHARFMRRMLAVALTNMMQNKEFKK